MLSHQAYLAKPLRGRPPRWNQTQFQELMRLVNSELDSARRDRPRRLKPVSEIIIHADGHSAIHDGFNRRDLRRVWLGAHVLLQLADRIRSEVEGHK